MNKSRVNRAEIGQLGVYSGWALVLAQFGITCQCSFISNVSIIKCRGEQERGEQEPCKQSGDWAIWVYRAGHSIVLV